MYGNFDILDVQIIQGETVFTNVTNDATGAAGGSAVATYDDRERIIHLEKRVKELQAKLTVKEVRTYVIMASTL